jgi:hypothetical protein
MSITSAMRRTQATVEAAILRAGGDVVEDELVRALVTVAQGMLDDVADIAVIAELDALDDAAVLTSRQGMILRAGIDRVLEVDRLLPQRLADDRAGRPVP